MPKSILFFHIYFSTPCLKPPCRYPVYAPDNHVTLSFSSFARVALHDESRAVQHVCVLSGLFWHVFDFTGEVYMIQFHD